jgi:hypothetical protein
MVTSGSLKVVGCGTSTLPPQPLLLLLSPPDMVDFTESTALFSMKKKKKKKGLRGMIWASKEIQEGFMRLVES